METGASRRTRLNIKVFDFVGSIYCTMLLMFLGGIFSLANDLRWMSQLTSDNESFSKLDHLVYPSDGVLAPGIARVVSVSDLLGIAFAFQNRRADHRLGIQTREWNSVVPVQSHFSKAVKCLFVRSGIFCILL